MSELLECVNNKYSAYFGPFDKNLFQKHMQKRYLIPNVRQRFCRFILFDRSVLEPVRERPIHR